MSNIEPTAEPQKRQYTVKYQRGGNPAIQLEPGVNDDLCARPEVAFGIAFMQAHPFVEIMGIRLGDDAFMLAALLPGHSRVNGKAFTFKEAAPSIVLPEVR